jgi:hypothetical protein
MQSEEESTPLAAVVVLAAQRSQATEAGAAAKVPSGHGTHATAPPPVYTAAFALVLEATGTGASWLHWSQHPIPSPFAHALQGESWLVPRLAVVLEAANLPAGHGLQEEAPMPAVVVFCGHTAHEVPTAEKEPLLHGEHPITLPPSGAWPVGHPLLISIAAVAPATYTVSPAKATVDSGHAPGLVSTAGAVAARA